MANSLKTLIIEDNSNDVILLVRELRTGGYEPIYEVAEHAQAMLAALQRQSWDAVLCDFTLPRFDGFEALKILRQSGQDLPFIVVSGHIGEDTAVDIMRAGASDVIMKSNLKRLIPAIARELQEAANRRKRREAEAALRWSNAKFELLSDTANLLLFDKTPETIQTICKKVMSYLNCDVFFNYLVDADRKRLRLNACAGLSPEAAKCVEWLDFGEEVCGCVAREACPLIVEDVQHRVEDNHTAVIRSLGIQAYACHPILSGQGIIIGTLSFGSRQKDRFNSGELDVMKVVTSQVAIALDRLHYEEQLESYAKRITQVQEEERKRVARELHDDTAQSLAILSLELDALISNGEGCSARSLERLQAIKANTDRTMQDIRRYSHELHSSLLDHLGLTAALEQLVQENNERDGLLAELDIQGKERKLPEEVELALFRITQQALRNIWQHAQATEAQVTLRYLPDKVELAVSDNGKGFNPEAAGEAAVKRGSLGLVQYEGTRPPYWR